MTALYFEPVASVNSHVMNMNLSIISKITKTKFDDANGVKYFGTSN